MPPIGVFFPPPPPPRAFRVISAPSAFLLPPLNPVNPVKNQPVPSPPLALRVSDTMAVRQNTVRKSAFCRGVGGPPAYLTAVAECVAQSLVGTRPWRVSHRGCGILPRRFGAACCFRFWECRSFGGREVLAAKDAKDLRHRYRVLYNECMTCGNKVRLGSACAQERFWDNS